MDRRAGDLDRCEPDDSGTARLTSDGEALHSETSRIYRSVVLLRDIEELDTDETARSLAITPNTVKVRLHRARQALKALIEREPGLPFPDSNHLGSYDREHRTSL